MKQAWSSGLYKILIAAIIVICLVPIVHAQDATGSPASGEQDTIDFINDNWNKPEAREQIGQMLADPNTMSAVFFDPSGEAELRITEFLNDPRNIADFPLAASNFYSMQSSANFRVEEGRSASVNWQYNVVGDQRLLTNGDTTINLFNYRQTDTIVALPDGGFIINGNIFRGGSVSQVLDSKTKKVSYQITIDGSTTTLTSPSDKDKLDVTANSNGKLDIKGKANVKFPDGSTLKILNNNKPPVTVFMKDVTEPKTGTKIPAGTFIADDADVSYKNAKWKNLPEARIKGKMTVDGSTGDTFISPVPGKGQSSYKHGDFYTETNGGMGVNVVKGAPPEKFTIAKDSETGFVGGAAYYMLGAKNRPVSASCGGFVRCRDESVDDENFDFQGWGAEARYSYREKTTSEGTFKYEAMLGRYTYAKNDSKGKVITSNTKDYYKGPEELASKIGYTIVTSPRKAHATSVISPKEGYEGNFMRLERYVDVYKEGIETLEGETVALPVGVDKDRKAVQIDISEKNGKTDYKLTDDTLQIFESNKHQFISLFEKDFLIEDSDGDFYFGLSKQGGLFEEAQCSKDAEGQISNCQVFNYAGLITDPKQVRSILGEEVIKVKDEAQLERIKDFASEDPNKLASIDLSMIDSETLEDITKKDSAFDTLVECIRRGEIGAGDSTLASVKAISGKTSFSTCNDYISGYATANKKQRELDDAATKFINIREQIKIAKNENNEEKRDKLVKQLETVQKQVNNLAAEAALAYVNIAVFTKDGPDAMVVRELIDYYLANKEDLKATKVADYIGNKDLVMYTLSQRSGRDRREELMPLLQKRTELEKEGVITYDATGKAVIDKESPRAREAQLLMNKMEYETARNINEQLYYLSKIEDPNSDIGKEMKQRQLELERSYLEGVNGEIKKEATYLRDAYNIDGFGEGLQEFMKIGGLEVGYAIFTDESSTEQWGDARDAAYTAEVSNLQQNAFTTSFLYRANKEKGLSINDITSMAPDERKKLIAQMYPGWTPSQVSEMDAKFIGTIERDNPDLSYINQLTDKDGTITMDPIEVNTYGGEGQFTIKAEVAKLPCKKEAPGCPEETVTPADVYFTSPRFYYDTEGQQMVTYGSNPETLSIIQGEDFEFWGTMVTVGILSIPGTIVGEAIIGAAGARLGPTIATKYPALFNLYTSAPTASNIFIELVGGTGLSLTGPSGEIASYLIATPAGGLAKGVRKAIDNPGTERVFYKGILYVIEGKDEAGRIIMREVADEATALTTKEGQRVATKEGGKVATITFEELSKASKNDLRFLGKDLGSSWDKYTFSRDNPLESFLGLSARNNFYDNMAINDVKSMQKAIDADPELKGLFKVNDDGTISATREGLQKIEAGLVPC